MRITVNPDKDYVEKIRTLLRKGDNYCPCKPQKTSDNKCMCKEFSEQKTSGWCHCGLYYKQIEETDEVKGQ